MADQKSGKLLNHFAFPSETQLRSILLIWAILGLCWSLGFSFAKVLVGTLGWPAVDKLPAPNPEILRRDWETSPTPDNVQKLLEHTGVTYQELEKPGGRARMQMALADQSMAAHLRLKAIQRYFVIPFLFLALTLLCILVRYVVRAHRLWLSGHASSRSAEEPEFLNALQSLIREAQELQRQQGERPMPQPRFLVSSGALGNGQAFGTTRRPFILLTRAMSTILRKDIRQYGKPYRFRAIVFHELAHLANRDVTRSYWAEASWIVLVPMLALLIATLSMFRSSSWSLVWLQVGVRMIAILLVIEWIRRGILRSREYEADLRTALLWNAKDTLRFSLYENERDTNSPSGLWNRFARLWRKHPTPSERRDVLDHPSRTLGLNRDVPFLAGLLCGNLIGSILPLTALIMLTTSALGDLMANSAIEEFIHSRGPRVVIHLYPLWGIMMFISSLALLCAVSYLLAGTLGVQTQRESVFQMAEADRNPHPYRALLKPAFFTAVGFEIGLILVPTGPGLSGQAWGFLGLFMWVLFAPLPFWGWLSLTRFFAGRLLGTHFALRKPVRQLRIVIWASAILLWPLILMPVVGQLWLWSVIQGAWIVMVLGGVIVFLGFLLALMLLALAVREVRREEKLPRCPHCGSEVSATSVAADCAACGNSVAPWLFIEAPSTLKAGVA